MVNSRRTMKTRKTCLVYVLRRHNTTYFQSVTYFLSVSTPIKKNFYHNAYGLTTNISSSFFFRSQIKCVLKQHKPPRCFSSCQQYSIQDTSFLHSAPFRVYWNPQSEIFFVKFESNRRGHSEGSWKSSLLFHLQVDDYPTLLFYKANDKSNPVPTSCYIHFRLLYLFILLSFQHPLLILLGRSNFLRDLARRT